MVIICRAFSMFVCNENKLVMGQIKIDKGISANINFVLLREALKDQLSNEQKAKLVISFADFHGAIDMSYLEDVIVRAAKIRLKSIKKDKELYKRNREYFDALKTIIRVKEAE